ncbi:MAG: iron-containing alcohol dehydrogenase, partial [Candidatus Levyibacteriota bacterium]
MKKILVTIKKEKQDCPIFIGEGIIGKLKYCIDVSAYSKILIITDETVKSLFLKEILIQMPVSTNFIILPNGEQAKDTKSVKNILEKLISIGADRKSLIINLGGGVISDVGGFAASIFMRGIACINIPTTLLAQVDAS